MIPQIVDEAGEVDRVYPERPLHPKLLFRLRAKNAKPTRLLRVLDTEVVDQHRNLACLHYDLCLDTAVAANWMSYSCAECPNYAGGKDQTGGQVSEVSGTTRRGGFLP
jgi:hypothetical protein